MTCNASWGRRASSSVGRAARVLPKPRLDFQSSARTTNAHMLSGDPVPSGSSVGAGVDLEVATQSSCNGTLGP